MKKYVMKLYKHSKTMSREDEDKYMKTDGPYCPWEHAYQLAKPHYTREEVDEMHFCEIDEILNQEDDE